MSGLLLLESHVCAHAHVLLRHAILQLTWGPIMHFVDLYIIYSLYYNAGSKLTAGRCFTAPGHQVLSCPGGVPQDILFMSMWVSSALNSQNHTSR